MEKSNFLPFYEFDRDGNKVLISNESDRKNYMFKNNLKEAPSRRDIDENNRRAREREAVKFDNDISSVVKRTIDAELYGSGNHEKIIGEHRTRKKQIMHRSPRDAEFLKLYLKNKM